LLRNILPRSGWDGQGACLFGKRLEKGRFVWPSAKEGKIALTAAQLAMLLAPLGRFAMQIACRAMRDRLAFAATQLDTAQSGINRLGTGLWGFL